MRIFLEFFFSVQLGREHLHPQHRGGVEETVAPRRALQTERTPLAAEKEQEMEGPSRACPELSHECHRGAQREKLLSFFSKNFSFRLWIFSQNFSFVFFARFLYRGSFSFQLIVRLHDESIVRRVLKHVDELLPFFSANPKASKDLFKARYEKFRHFSPSLP